MKDLKESDNGEIQWEEYEEVKKKFDEFKNFKRITNKPFRLVVKKEDILREIEKSGIAEKYDERNIYQWIRSYSPSRKFYEI